jgi:signal transduction histidine kinase
MIPNFFITWALVAVSLFNTILLLWLGITLWLNANRRDLGIVVIAVGFLLGSAFFVAHAALLLSDTWQLTRSNTLWLAVAVTPVTLLPYVWYVVLLRYSGYWADEDSDLRRRHHPWVVSLAVILLIGLGCLVLLGIPYVPIFRGLMPWVWSLRAMVKTELFGIPLVALGYSLYVLACVLLSLDALHRPGASNRMLGDVARARARPWLVAASLLLTAVGVLVAAVLVWTITNTRYDGVYLLTRTALATIGWFDLVISVLIAAVVLLLGQAMTTYELFTEKPLPRQGLARQWRRSITLAAGYGVLMGGALAWGLEPVYAVLLTALLMTVFFALLSWRASVDWEQAMRQLRPFVTSQHWYEAVTDVRPGEQELTLPFRALCENLLNTTTAHLLPIGSTATLVSPQSYPAAASAPTLDGLAQRNDFARRLIVGVDPAQYGGAIWAVALWREQGLVGALLLGPRRDGSLYAQEEIEIARATGERLIDLTASVALSQRLMALQRERMAATQVLDQQTRRALHDEVLPLIHTAMLSLASGATTEAAIQQLSAAHQEVSNLLRALPPTVAPEIARLGLLDALKRMVAVEFSAAFDEVTWRCDEGIEAQAARLSPLAAETLYYAAREAVRNAAKHARQPDRPAGLRLTLAAHVADHQFQLAIADNGPGLPQTPGNGQGLALHSTLMAVVGGSLALETLPGQGTRVVLAVGVG